MKIPFLPLPVSSHIPRLKNPYHRQSRPSHNSEWQSRPGHYGTGNPAFYTINRPLQYILETHLTTPPLSLLSLSPIILLLWSPFLSNAWYILTASFLNPCFSRISAIVNV